MPIFNQKLDIKNKNQNDALQEMADYMQYMTRTLERKLTSLDSSNIVEIDTGITNIETPQGGGIVSDYIDLKGKQGETFKVGFDKVTQQFIFSLTGKNGDQYMYLSDGTLIITKKASITIDAGTWN